MEADQSPLPPPVSHSFTRMDQDSTRSISPKNNASPLQEAGIPVVPEARIVQTSPDSPATKPMADVFENNEDEEGDDGGDALDRAAELNVPSTFDELPVEIKSLCKRFLDSLSAKVHPTPLNAEQLSGLFQDFYERAASHIATHIASLSSRTGRVTPPVSSPSSSSREQLGRPRSSLGAVKGSSDNLADQAEMLTPLEVTDRRRARKLLEHKRAALEEAVERGVCEKVYEKIWKHRSTEDDARDEKLRSRTAALALVGIGLTELHMDRDPAKADIRKTTKEKEDEINLSLSEAREALQKMDANRYPLGKLQNLIAAHKSIVETLSRLFPSSSSADEILPTLIYTLITCPQTGINVVSNLNFIQRFRGLKKVDGEAAYCMVNLEAAISFLETVDLSSLRSDELPEGPAKRTGNSTPVLADESISHPEPQVGDVSTAPVSSVTATPSDQSTPSGSANAALASISMHDPASRPPMHQRNISDLMQAQVVMMETGRDNFLSAADKIYDSINGTLDNSLQFVFGRFKEKVAAGDSRLPQTLEDARKLVSSHGKAEDEELLSHSSRSSPTVDDPLTSSPRPDKVLDLIGGTRKLRRDRSTDSARSSVGSRFASGDSKNVAPRDLGAKEEQRPTPQSNMFSSAIISINPLGKFGMPTFPRFGVRSSSGGSALNINNSTQPSTSPDRSDSSAQLIGTEESPSGCNTGEGEQAFTVGRRIGSKEESLVRSEHSKAREALAELRKLKPPNKRFMEIQSVNHLKVGEVEDLLMEYRRLAKAIGRALTK